MNYKISALVLCGILAIAPAAMAETAPAAMAQSQDKVTVKGVVVDENGETVPGAAILIPGTTTGTTTDLDGAFTLSVPADATLQVVSVGFTTLDIPVNGRADLGTITIRTEQTLLTEVVVVGYGTQKKVDLTGSVAVVDADEVKKVSNSNISTLLEGKVAGVQITTDGQPGADPTVRVRGLGSFGDTSPLYVIDGVPMGTSIRDFSPNDIATIQVLKDASAAAIYGSRAGNGVVIITTKQGKKNQPMKIDFSGYVGIDKIKKGVYDVMDTEQYITHLTSAYANSDQVLPVGYDPTSASYLGGIDTDWFDEMFKTGIRQNYNVNMSGGGENNTYNIGLDYYGQEGTLTGAGPNFDRFTARVNNTMDVKFLKFRTGITYSHSKQDNLSTSNADEYVAGLYGEQYPIMANALIVPPTIKAYDESTWVLDDVLAAASEYSYDSYGYGTYYESIHGDIRINNPLLMNNLIERNTTTDRIVATGSMDADLFDMVGYDPENMSLKYTLNLSYSTTYAKDFSFVPSYIASSNHYLAKDSEVLNEGYRRYDDGLVENYLTFDGEFGKHHVNAVVGMTYEHENYHTLTGTGYSLSEPYYLQLSNASSTQSYSYESEHVLASYIGRVNYDYDERYLIQATVRRDGSSRLSSADRWDWFPSVSAGWRIDREPFFTIDKRTVSLLKIRGSYGELGNENIGEYQYMDTMTRGNYTYSFGNNKVTGSSISNYVNTGIAWEKKKSLDIGLDLAMFDSKLEFNFDYYKNISEDLLYSVPVPAEGGATNESVTMNAATMENSGLEFALSYHNYQHALKYDLSGNISTLKNKVTKLGMTDDDYLTGNYLTRVGEEVGQFYGYYSLGIFQSQEEIDNYTNANGEHVTQNGAQPGDIKYEDINLDGEITDADQKVLGSGMPDVNFGFNAHLEYKNFDLDVSMYGAAGFKVYDYVDALLHSSYGVTNKSTDLLNAWTPENTNTDVPRVYYKSTGSITNDLFSQRYLQNGAYLKLANVQLGYNFKDEWFHGLISNARIYVSAQNLFTITAYEGYNIDFAGGTFTPGYNYCSYPSPITLTCGVQLSF